MAAAKLGGYLGHISGAAFRVEEGDGQAGIAWVGPKTFLIWGCRRWRDARDATRREGYLLRSHSKGLQVIGATDAAMQYAV